MSSKIVALQQLRVYITKVCPDSNLADSIYSYLYNTGIIRPHNGQVSLSDEMAKRIADMSQKPQVGDLVYLRLRGGFYLVFNEHAIENGEGMCLSAVKVNYDSANESFQIFPWGENRDQFIEFYLWDGAVRVRKSGFDIKKIQELCKKRIELCRSLINLDNQLRNEKEGAIDG